MPSGQTGQISRAFVYVRILCSSCNHGGPFSVDQCCIHASASSRTFLVQACPVLLLTSLMPIQDELIKLRCCTCHVAASVKRCASRMQPPECVRRVLECVTRARGLHAACAGACREDCKTLGEHGATVVYLSALYMGPWTTFCVC